MHRPSSTGWIARARRLLPLMALAGLAGAGWPDVSTDLPLPPGLTGVPVEEVEVRLVMLHATVLDRRGETVPSLSPEDFRLTENGVPQAITVFGSGSEQPLRIAFLLDISGSMGMGGKLERAKAAIRQFVDALRPRDEVGLMVFADGDVVVETAFTTDRGRFLARLDRQEAFGKSAVRDALAAAPGLLTASRSGRKALFLVTDGIDNASELNAFEAVRTARRVQVPIYVLGLRDLPLGIRSSLRQGRGRSFVEVLAEFASETGGEMFPAFAPDEVDQAVTRVEERLRGQYVLGYRPPEGHEGLGFRRIELVTSNHRHEVRTRQGYYHRPDRP